MPDCKTGKPSNIHADPSHQQSGQTGMQVGVCFRIQSLFLPVVDYQHVLSLF